MALAYTEGKSLVSTLLADLNTAVLASTDWTRPNSGSRPNTYKATSAAGCDMVVDLADAAVNNMRLQVAFYTSYDGTTLGQKSTGTRYLNFKEQNTGATGTNWVYWWVSASKEHLYIMVEGPRAIDANADNATYGSMRQYMFISSLTPYFTSPTDPTPCAIAYATRQPSNNPAYSLFDHKAIVTRQVTQGQQYWGNGTLLSLEWPAGITNYGISVNRTGLDGNQFMAPYVYFDDVDGLRGRLSSLYYGGPAQPIDDSMTTTQPAFTPNTKVTYSGQTYKWLTANRTSNNNSTNIWGPLGAWSNVSGYPIYLNGPLVAVPST